MVERFHIACSFARINVWYTSLRQHNAGVELTSFLKRRKKHLFIFFLLHQLPREFPSDTKYSVKGSFKGESKASAGITSVPPATVFAGALDIQRCIWQVLGWKDLCVIFYFQNNARRHSAVCFHHDNWGSDTVELRCQSGDDTEGKPHWAWILTAMF